MIGIKREMHTTSSDCVMNVLRELFATHGAPVIVASYNLRANGVAERHVQSAKET